MINSSWLLFLMLIIWSHLSSSYNHQLWDHTSRSHLMWVVALIHVLKFLSDMTHWRRHYSNIPFKITKRSNRHFTLYIKGKESIVSIDHLKLAYLESTEITFQTPDFSPSTVSSTPSPYTVTCSWRHVRLPTLLINISPDYWGGVLVAVMWAGIQENSRKNEH